MKTASTIGAKTVVTGSVHGDGDLEVYGRVDGDITVEGSVLIAATAQVKGAVTASAIRVAGAIEGNLQASDTVAIEPDARVLGDLTTPRISIAEGAIVRGMVRTEVEQRPARKTVAGSGERNPSVERGTPDRATPLARPAPVAAPPERLRTQEVVPTPAAVDPLPAKKDKEARERRPPEPKMPALAKGTKGKKKGDKRPH